MDDFLAELYAERFALHPEYRPTEWETNAARARARWIEEADLEQQHPDLPEEKTA